VDFVHSTDRFLGARVAPAPARTRTTPPLPVKIIIAGGFGVGKTTTVGAISEIDPLTTEAEMTTAAVGLDVPGEESGKTTTTIASVRDALLVVLDQALARAIRLKSTS
jgi:uncharacterized protein